jgi:CTP synthase (UTP-ammonia lyase)
VGKTMQVMLRPASHAHRCYETERAEESYYCNFGLNDDYRADLEAAGLITSGIDHDGELRIVELADHPFFLATLFVPQARSIVGSPHPLIVGFGDAAAHVAVNVRTARRFASTL